MSLFEELGIRPGEAGIMALKSELESRRSLWARDGYHYKGAGDLLLQHGTFWTGRAVPDEYRDLQGEPSQCYANSMRGCDARPELRYVEGVMSTGAGHYVSHGWCIAPDDGVVELTLPTVDFKRYTHAHTNTPFLPPDRWSYCGVVVSMDLVRWHERIGGLPMLDRPRADITTSPGWMDMEEAHDWPILKLPFDPNRTDLEGV